MEGKGNERKVRHPAIQPSNQPDPTEKGMNNKTRRKVRGGAGGRAGDVFIDLASFLKVW